MDWISEEEGSHERCAERWLPELAPSYLQLNEVANPKSILDIQPTHLRIHRRFKKEDVLYLRHLHRLEYLHTNKSGVFNDIQVEAAFLDRLNTLVIFDPEIKSSAIQLGRSLKQLTQLTRLDMGCSGEVLPILAPFMSELTTLQQLSLANLLSSRLSGDGNQKMLSCLKLLTQLNYLHVQNLVDGSDATSSLGWFLIVFQLPRLTTLSFPSNEFDPSGIETVCKSMSRFSRITHLNLSKSTMDEGSANALGKAVGDFPILHLELGDITWESGGWEAFVAQFDHWPMLKSLNLESKWKSEQLSTEQTIELARQLSKLTSLIMLNITCCQPDDFVLEPLTSLPGLQVFVLNAPPGSEDILEQAFPSKRIVYDDVYHNFLIHDASLPTMDYYSAYMPLLFPTEPVGVTSLPPHTPHYWTRFESFKPIDNDQLNTYLMQPMLYHHFRYPEQAHLLWTQQDWDVSFLESILLNQLPEPEDMNTALVYYRWSEIMGYNSGLIHFGDYIQRYLTVDNLVSTAVYFHDLKKAILPHRDASGEHFTGESNDLVCWDGLLSYFVSKWKEWCLNNDTKNQLLASSKGHDITFLLIKAMEDGLNVEWKMKEDLQGDWERRHCLFKTTYYFLHLSPRLRPDMTVVIHHGLKVMHLHSHVVWNRWGLTSQLQHQARMLGKSKSVIYHLHMSAKMAELVGCLMEYCYTGEVAKLECLKRYQVEMIGEMYETTIYSVHLMKGTPVLDPYLMEWRKSLLSK